jgi:nucleoside-diphosphate kinase
MNLKIKEETSTKTDKKEEEIIKEDEPVKQEAKYEKSLIIIKPDGVRKKIIGKIISRFEESGLEIERIRVLHIDENIAYAHYKDHIDKPYFERLLKYMTGGPSIVMVVKGENAIARARELMGPTDPKKAPKGTIRGDFGTDITINVIHGSDCPKAAQREINIFFGNYL